MRRARRLGFGAALALFAAVAALLTGWAASRQHALDLGEAPGPLTGRALAGLGRQPARCRALLDRAGVRFAVLSPRREGPRCGWTAALRLGPGGARSIGLAPSEPPLTCPVAAALVMWEWAVVQPAARRYLGAPVTGIEHLGSYNCRHIAGSQSWSEHAAGNALDVAAFRLADGRRVSVRDDWRGRGPAATFLRQVRNGACGLYATVLSPDYNAAHRDHLHLDQAARGEWRWRACR
ncbi:extensin family protein [Sphingomonas sp.]|uniref:extensin family protein n=1 Tax=Sphingomonas sp. TaxID=28214 RepID=UPI003CC69CE2